MSVFNGKILLITGGTGSFGNAVLRRFLESDIKEIRIFSRDEKKQDDMRHRIQSDHLQTSAKVKFYIGDVRNRESVDAVMTGVDYVFSAAALKQVPSCEFFPIEAVKTNILGTNNVLLSAIAHADAMLVSLKDEYIFSLTIPAKTQSYMCCGKPIVTMVSGEANKIIKEANCGFTANSGNYKTLAENVVKMYKSDKNKLNEMGENGKKYYYEHFAKQIVIDDILATM